MRDLAIVPGGPQRGSGRPPLKRRDWVRSEPLRTMFRPSELADLRALADAWRVPVATVAWAIVHDQLTRLRKKAPELGETGLAIAAAAAVLRLKGDPADAGDQ